MSAPDGSLWGERFYSESNNLQGIQNTIIRQLTSTLKLESIAEEDKSAIARFTENAQAYQSYLRGRHYWSNYTRESIEKALCYFKEALKLDPNYALAYAGIIDCYLRLCYR